LIEPVVGPVTFDKIFKRVDFPAPFLPIIPRTSPFLTSKLISFKAQTYSDSPFVALLLDSPTFKYGSSLPLIFAKNRLKS